MTTNDTIEALEAQNEEFRDLLTAVQPLLGRGALRRWVDKALQSPRHDLSNIKALLKADAEYYTNRGLSIEQGFTAVNAQNVAWYALSPEQRESILKGGE